MSKLIKNVLIVLIIIANISLIFPCPAYAFTTDDEVIKTVTLASSVVTPGPPTEATPAPLPTPLPIETETPGPATPEPVHTPKPTPTVTPLPEPTGTQPPATPTPTTITGPTGIEGEPQDPLKGNFWGGLLDGFLGIILIPVKLLLVIPAALVRLGMEGIAGEKDVTLQKIFFNQIDVVNINIFEAGDETLSSNIAKYYVAFRNLSITIAFAVLIYIGIRMATNSLGEERAKYKGMLVNWLVSFALLFVMQYIIYFVIKANELLVKGLMPQGTTTDVMGALRGLIWKIPFTTSFAAIAMYIGLLLMTFIFLITYIKRMVTVSFLIVISPLVCVTYSVDKIGNNKSEILNNWLKEFFYNVLIQPFHCIIYSILIFTAYDLIKDGSDFGSMAFAIILTFSIFSAQKLVREIFGFSNSKSFYEKAVGFMLVTQMYGTAKKAIKDVKAIKGAKNDIAAQRQEKMLSQIDSGGDEINSRNMVRYRMMAEANRDGSNVDGGGAANTQTKNTGNISTQTKNKIDINRPMKKAPRIVKRAARSYTRQLKRFTGYNAVNSIVKGRKRARYNPKNLNKKDYAIALAEMYRQKNDKAMDNIRLADEYERIRDADISNLSASELSFRVQMDALKQQLKLKESDIRDAIIYGSGHNRRWRG